MESTFLHVDSKGVLQDSISEVKSSFDVDFYKSITNVSESRVVRVATRTTFIDLLHLKILSGSCDYRDVRNFNDKNNYSLFGDVDNISRELLIAEAEYFGIMARIL